MFKKIIKNEIFREVFLSLLAFWIVFSILFGTGAALEDKSGCRYHSLISRVNIPYIISCELWRSRW